MMSISWARIHKLPFDSEAGRVICKDYPRTRRTARSGTRSGGSQGPKPCWHLPLAPKAASWHSAVHNTPMCYDDERPCSPYLQARGALKQDRESHGSPSVLILTESTHQGRVTLEVSQANGRDGRPPPLIFSHNLLTHILWPCWIIAIPPVAILANNRVTLTRRARNILTLRKPTLSFDNTQTSRRPRSATTRPF